MKQCRRDLYAAADCLHAFLRRDTEQAGSTSVPTVDADAGAMLVATGFGYLRALALSLGGVKEE